MQIIPLNNQGRLSGFTHRARITHTDLTVTATATAQVIPLYTGKKGTTITRVATYVRTAFSDASDSAFNDSALTIGDTGSAARFLASQQLNVNGTEVMAKHGTGTLHTYAAAGSAAILNATFGSMTAKSLSELDAGEIDIFFGVAELGEASADSQGE